MIKLAHCLWFDGKAEEAARFYVSVFPDARLGRITRYGKEGVLVHGQPAGSVMTVEFELMGLRYQAINGGPQFRFNEAFSIVVQCNDQAEVDHYWRQLTQGGGEPGPCGWLKDRFGVSWQVVPVVLYEMVSDPDPVKSGRVTKAFLEMSKFDIAALEKAWEGR